MKKISLIICILVLLLTGCNKGYEYKENGEINDTTKENNNVNDTTENNKETSNNKHNSFSMTTALLVESKADDMWMDARTEGMKINEGTNVIRVKPYCEPDPSQKWDVLTVRCYVVADGIPVSFSLSGREKNIFQDVECNAFEQGVFEFEFEHTELSADSGIITVMVMFNPEAFPEIGVGSFSGAQWYSFSYSNEYYSGQSDTKLAVVEDVYINIPEEYVQDSFRSIIGTNDIYTEEYNFKNSYYFEDLKADSVDDVYAYINCGRSISGESAFGIVCDGKLMQFSDGQYFKIMNSDDGRITLKYSLSEFDNIQPGLHYFQIIHISFELNENMSEADISTRYRVNIGVDTE